MICRPSGAITNFRLYLVVHDDPRDAGEQGTASIARAIERQQDRAGHVQPLRLAADAKAGLVHVFHRRVPPRGRALLQ